MQGIDVQQVEAAVGGEGVRFVRQEPQLGTGHAIQQVVPALQGVASVEASAQWKQQKLELAVKRLSVQGLALAPEPGSARADEPAVVRIATNPDRFVENDRPLRRDRVRTEHGIRPDEIVGLFCGMNYRLKGLPCLLAAMRHLPAGNRFRLLAVGADNYKAMEKLARHLGVCDRVVFAGYRKDMRDGYFAADMFIHPTFYDPCSHVVPEAMSCGLPVITTRHNGAAELMSPPREGVVIDDPHNHRALARAIEKFFDPRERQRCGQAGRQAASRWTFDQHYRQMLDVFSEAARRRHAA